MKSDVHKSVQGGVHGAASPAASRGEERPCVAIVRTGTANIASVLACLRRAGAEPMLTESPEEVSSAAWLVLPGVGAFGAAMGAIESRGLASPLRRRIEEGRPTLCICLGLQLLAEGSQESPGVGGLGVMRGMATRLRPPARVPHMGWNAVEPEAECRLLRQGYAAYANSYKLDAVPTGWSAAWTTHGERFVAAAERGAVLACQFHPELSGPWGAELIGRWLAAGSGAC